MILDDNVFIEQVLPATVANRLDEEDLNAYRHPYPTRGSRRPLLAWPRAMPLDGEPAGVVARIDRYDRWLAASPEVPKLLLAFDPGPGSMMTAPLIQWCAANIAGLEVEKCGAVAGHHTPEDQPAAIAKAISSWLDRHNLRSPDEN